MSESQDDVHGGTDGLDFTDTSSAVCSEDNRVDEIKQEYVYLEVARHALHCLKILQAESDISTLLLAMGALLQDECSSYGTAVTAPLITRIEEALKDSELPPELAQVVSDLDDLKDTNSHYRKKIDRLAPTVGESIPIRALTKRRHSSAISNTSHILQSAPLPSQAKKRRSSAISNTSHNSQAAPVSKQAKKTPKQVRNVIAFEDEEFQDSAGNKINGLRKVMKVRIEPDMIGGGSHRPTPAERGHIFQESNPQVGQQNSTSASIELQDDDEVLRDLVEAKLQISLNPIDKRKYPNATPHPKVQSAGVNTKARLDRDAAPISNINEIFQVMARKLATIDQFAEACNAFTGCGLRVFTMCSGTESPLLALQLLGDALEQQGVSEFPIKHLGSAEITPFKQAYIQRNFKPTVLFRDVTEFIDRDSQPHTAFGGTASQPEEVHILVAGSSCVDYSTLNSKPKKFGQKGQSYDTLQGIRAYAKNYRPAIIVLENVKGAPWIKIRDFFAEIEYYGVVLGVDTKDFYLPQTRQRGYMVAFDRLRAAEIGLDLEHAATILVDTLVSLAQRASSPYTDFIFADDDPELREFERVVAKLERNGSTDTKVSDWSKCRIRYCEFRTLEKLGMMRPLTKWRNNGKCQFLDYAWMYWASIQRERIWDTLDINFLFFVAKRDFDMNFKSKWMDLSQNVDRNNDSTPWGIVGCVTPSGMPFDTRRGGPVFGKEVLALQGIPAKNLSLNKESSAQLQDLAGNAMTSTVVCAVLAAAIAASLNRGQAPSPGGDEDTMRIDSKSMFKHVDDASSVTQDKFSSFEPRLGAWEVKQLTTACKVPLEQKLVSARLSDHSTDLTSLLTDARLALQLCRCEGLTSAKPVCFKICQACGHTACQDCAGNPVHKYLDLKPSFIKNRKEPDIITQGLNALLPPLLQLSLTNKSKSVLLERLANEAKNFDEHNWQSRDIQTRRKKITAQAYKINPEELAKYKDTVSEALISKVYLQSIRHGHIWKVTYGSSSASLELRLFQQHNHAESSRGFSSISKLTGAWYLYALPNRGEPAQCWLRDVLARPIARFTLAGQNLFDGQWEIWSPSMPVIDLKIQGKNEVNSWERSIGIRDDRYRDSTVFSELTIMSDLEPSSKDGSFTDRNRIRGQICGVYQLEQMCGAANGSLYRKKKLASNAMSIFFFLDPKHIGNAALDRFVFASCHERLPLGVDRHVIAEMDRGWRPSTQKIDSAKSDFTCRLIDCWIPANDLQFDSGEDLPALDFWVPAPCSNFISSSADCYATSTLFVAKLPETDSSLSKQWKQDYQYPIDMVGRPGTLDQYQWLLRQLHRVLPLEEYEIKIDREPGECPCAPRLPELEWLISRKVNTKQIIIKPFENDKAATDYEHELKKRPSPVVAIVHWYGVEGYLELRVNIPTLVHRVCRQLSVIDKSTILKWRLIKSASTEVAPRFPEIISPKDLIMPAWPQNDIAYARFPNAEKPRKFLDRKMWEGQRQTLAWMRKLEAENANWSEWELEDISLPALGLNLQVEASSSVSIRGGVVADEVGAGKTTTSLALIARGMEDHVAPTFSPKTVSSGRIPSKATLILVPANLIPQWESEIIECFGGAATGKANLGLVVISNAHDIRNFTIKELGEADIVLAPWNMFEDGKYWSNMRELCLIANVPEVPGRGFQQWLDNATADLQDLAQKSHGCTDVTTFWHHRESRAQEKRRKYSKFHAFRQIDGETSAEHKQKVIQTLDPTKAQASYPVSAEYVTGLVDADFDRLKNISNKQITPLLHFFDFQRLIVDEFTYLEGKSLLSILKLEARHRWMLSGTPPLSTYDSVNTIAKLLGTKITVENEKDGVFSFARTKVNAKNDKSYAEEFREQTQMRSPSWLRKRNEKAQEFAAKFIHKRSAPPAIVKQIPHYDGVDMSVAESILVLRAYHRLMRQTVKFQGTQKVPSKDIMEEKRLFNALEQAPNAEAGLLCCPADLLNDLVQDRDNFTSGIVCEEMITSKMETIGVLLDETHLALREALYLWDVKDLPSSSKKPLHAPTDLTHFGTFLNGIKDSIYGDSSVQNIMMNLVIDANQRAKEPKLLLSKGTGSRNVKSGRHGMPPFNSSPPVMSSLRDLRKELKERAADLDDMTRSLTEQVQQARLLRGISKIVEDDTRHIQCSGCKTSMPLSSLRILGLCGHFSCADCLENSPSFLDNPIGCVAAGCAAPATDSSVPAKLFARPHSDVVSEHGTKAHAVLTKIRAIQASNPDEMILVFVQYEAIRRQLLGALKSYGIKSEDACKNAEKVINGLKRMPKDQKALPPVLLLKIDSADAAGWNLQEYNHVMFVAPLQVKAKSDYKATMTQAVGRAFRYGQNKDVHVYHFVWSHTAEVNILQRMEGKRFVCVDGTYDLVGRRDGAGLEDLRGPSLAMVNAFSAGVDLEAAEERNDDEEEDFAEEEPSEEEDDDDNDDDEDDEDDDEEEEEE